MENELSNLFDSEDTTEGSNELADVFNEGEEVEEQEQAEVEHEQAETDTTEEADPVQEETNETPFELAYKYNHTEGKITDKEEAAKLLQIGMMYQDKIAPQMETLKANNQKLEKIQQLAELYGMDVDALHDSLYETYVNNQAEEQGVTPEMIRKERELADKERFFNQKEQQEQKKASETQMLDKFVSIYPDVSTKDIKEETWKMVDNGIDLVTAYTIQKNNELTQQLRTKEQNTKNNSSSPSVGATKYGGNEPAQEEDDTSGFLDHFR